jgi:hypothetical protein
MKKILLTIIISIFAIFITGCAKQQDQIFDIDKEKGIKKNWYDVNDSEKKDGIDLTSLSRTQRLIIYPSEKLRKTLKMAAEETLKNNKTDFIIIEESMNQLNGSLPINTFAGIKEYCLNDSLSKKELSYDKKCSALFDNFYGGTTEYIMVSNPDYTMMSINAKEILKELSEYKLTMEEIQKY